MLSRAPDWHTQEFEGLFLKFLIKKKLRYNLYYFQVYNNNSAFMTFYFPIVRLICTEHRVSQMYVQYTYTCVCAQSLSCVQLFVTPWTVAHQALLSMEFSRQEC